MSVLPLHNKETAVYLDWYLVIWRQRKLTQEYPYLYVDGLYFKRSWGGEQDKNSILNVQGDSCLRK